MDEHVAALHVVSEIAQQQHKDASQIIREHAWQTHLHDLQAAIEKINAKYQVEQKQTGLKLYNADHLPVAVFKNNDPQQFQVVEKNRGDQVVIQQFKILGSQLLKQQIHQQIANQLDQQINQINAQYHVLLELDDELVLTYDADTASQVVCWIKHFDPTEVYIDHLDCMQHLLSEHLDLEMIETFKKQATKLIGVL